MNLSRGKMSGIRVSSYRPFNIWDSLGKRRSTLMDSYRTIDMDIWIGNHLLSTRQTPWTV